MADTRCKVCNSPNRAVIEEQSSNGIPARVISHFVKVNFDEDISYVAIQAHLNKHMGKIENEKTATLTRDLEEGEGDLLKQIEGLENRLNAIEIIVAEQTSTASYTSFYSYNMAGKTVNQISYQDLVTELMPNSKDIHAQYKALADRNKTRIVSEGGLILTDESFIGPRAKLLAKDTKYVEEQLRKAEADLREREQERKNFQAQMTQLVEREKRAHKVGPIVGTNV